MDGNQLNYRKNSRAATPIVTMMAIPARALSAPLTAAGRLAATLGAMAGAGLGDALAGADFGAAEGSFWVEPATPPAAAGAAAPAGLAPATADGAGILTVGAAVGLGGRLMRTVSFLGCTLPMSEAASPPWGACWSSAIMVVRLEWKISLGSLQCQ